METRNTSVTQQLEQLYRDKIPNGTVQVFCVSNTDYWGKRNKTRDDALPFLELSGILKLRKHCLSIVAESQLRTAAIYVADEIPAFLTDVELWVQSGSGAADAQQKRAVRETLGELEEHLREVNKLMPEM